MSFVGTRPGVGTRPDAGTRPGVGTRPGYRHKAWVLGRSLDVVRRYSQELQGRGVLGINSQKDGHAFFRMSWHDMVQRTWRPGFYTLSCMAGRDFGRRPTFSGRRPTFFGRRPTFLNVGLRFLNVALRFWGAHLRWPAGGDFVGLRFLSVGLRFLNADLRFLNVGLRFLNIALGF